MFTKRYFVVTASSRYPELYGFLDNGLGNNLRMTGRGSQIQVVICSLGELSPSLKRIETACERTVIHGLVWTHQWYVPDPRKGEFSYCGWMYIDAHL